MFARIQKYFYVFVPFCIFCLLLLRNPFSDRTLIPNLEPFPDSIHYITPAFNLIRGRGLVIARNEYVMIPSVPLLYSLTLIPGFMLKSDVRMFYFTNVLLVLTSYVLLYQILKEVTKNTVIHFVCLLLFVLNPIMYWYPELAMAENLILPLFLGSVLLLLKKPQVSYVVIAALLAVSFYATKFASLPLSIAMSVLYFVHILQGAKGTERRTILVTYILSLFAVGGLYLIYELLLRNNNLIFGLFGLFSSVFSPKNITNAVSHQSAQGGNDFFSLSYVVKDTSAYLGWLVGRPMTVLWKQMQILPPALAVAGLGGIALSFFARKPRLSWILSVFMIFNVLLMATFYVADGRYFIIAIPSLVIGIGLLFSFLEEQLPTKKKAISVLCLMVVLLYGLFNVMRLKFDVMLNLRYAETPWYYLSVVEMDKQLRSQVNPSMPTPVVISALPPFFIDFYLHQPAILLPLSGSQEFQQHKQEAWGNYDYSNIPALYEQYFKAGHPVFLTKYGLGNEKILQDAFYTLLRTYDFEQISDGCFGQCAVYRMRGLMHIPEAIPAKK